MWDDEQNEAELWFPEITYSGAPDECGWHFRQGVILKYNDIGECPRKDEHPQGR